MLKEVVLALRREYGQGNIALRIAETGDLVAVLQVEDLRHRAVGDLVTYVITVKNVSATPAQNLIVVQMRAGSRP